MRSSFTRPESSWKAAAIVGLVQSRITPTLKVGSSRSCCSRLLQSCCNKYLEFFTSWQWGNHRRLIGLVQLGYSTQLHSAIPSTNDDCGAPSAEGDEEEIAEAASTIAGRWKENGLLLGYE